MTRKICIIEPIRNPYDQAFYQVLGNHTSRLPRYEAKRPERMFMVVHQPLVLMEQALTVDDMEISEERIVVDCIDLEKIGERDLGPREMLLDFWLYLVTPDGLAYHDSFRPPLTPAQERFVVTVEEYSWEAYFHAIEGIVDPLARDTWQETLKALSERFEWFGCHDRVIRPLRSTEEEYVHHVITTIEEAALEPPEDMFNDRYQPYDEGVLARTREIFDRFEITRPMPWDCSEAEFRQFYRVGGGELLVDTYSEVAGTPRFRPLDKLWMAEDETIEALDERSLAAERTRLKA